MRLTKFMFFLVLANLPLKYEFHVYVDCGLYHTYSALVNELVDISHGYLLQLTT